MFDNNHNITDYYYNSTKEHALVFIMQLTVTFHEFIHHAKSSSNAVYEYRYDVTVAAMLP